MSKSEHAPENSLFVRRIREALLANAPFSGILHVSISDEMKWEETNYGYKVHVRWACWNLEDSDGNVTEPHQSRFRLGIRKRLFALRVVKHCNRLPREVFDAPCLSVFKRHLYNTLLNVL